MLVLLVLAVGGVASAPVPRRAFLSYVVVAERADPSGAAAAAAAAHAAGGSVGPVHPAIGVVVAYAADPDFARRVRAAPGVEAAGATRTAPLVAPPAPRHAPPGRAGGDAAAGRAPTEPAATAHARTARAPTVRARTERAASVRRAGRAPTVRAASARAATGAAPVVRSATGEAATGRAPTVRASTVQPSAGASRGDARLRGDAPPFVSDPRERPAWNLAMIGADRARAAAARGTVVAVLDSGVDDTHPDLRAAVDPARSASCASGRPDPSPGAWRPLPRLPDSGHGTHIAGTIAAARDGRGVAGVAPGTRVAAVRLLDSAGQYYAENIICGFLWAVEHGAHVINNSYFADPWKYNCPGDPDQAAVTAAVSRAVAHAQRRGALVVASAGNDGQDLDAARVDRRSPNDRAAGSRPATRHLGADCIRLPGELPGVVGVTAVDRGGALAPYSNYGAGRGWFAAPGGDPDAGPEGQIVSTWPGGRYAALSGTSMAAAHVSAAAAVAAAGHPRAAPRRLLALLARAAVPRDCPSASGRAGGCPGEPYYGRGLLTVR